MSKTIIDAQRALRVETSNLQNQQATGARSSKVSFTTSAVSGGVSGGGSSYTESVVTTNIAKQGTVIHTGDPCNLAIQDSGRLTSTFFLVTDIPPKDGTKIGQESVLFTRNGNFQNGEGAMSVNDRVWMLFHKAGANGERLAIDSGDIGALDYFRPEEYAEIIPERTTEISVKVNFDAKEKALIGSGFQNCIFDTTGKNSTIKDGKDLIVPDNTAKGEIAIGMRMRLKTDTLDSTMNLEYGGLVQSFAPSNEKPIYGAKVAEKPFTIVETPVDNTQLANGSMLVITVNGEDKKFIAKKSDINPSQGQFNSLKTLANAINVAGGLIARVVGESLYIGPEDANHSVAFRSEQGGNLAGMLGLTRSIEKAEQGVKRFNSFKTMTHAISDDTYGLHADYSSTTSLFNITSRFTTSGIAVSGESYGVQSFNRVSIGDGTDKGRASVNIQAPGNNLQKGDFVRIKNFGNGQVPDGVYMVGKADANGFTIYALSNDPSAAYDLIAGVASGFADSNTINNISTNNTTWEKVAGQKFDKGDGQLTGGLSDAGGNEITLTITDLSADIVDGDVIFISGIGKGHLAGNDVLVPDGYYKISGVVPGVSFNIIAQEKVANGAPILPEFTNNNIYYHKVGHLAGNFGDAGTPTMPITVMESLAHDISNDAVEVIKVHIPNNKYRDGEMISFGHLVDDFMLDNIHLENGVNYRILETGNNWVHIEVPREAGATVSVGGVVSTYKDGDSGHLSSGFSINRQSRFMGYAGASQGAAGSKEQNIEAGYDPVNNSSKSLSSGNLNNKGKVWKNTLFVVDSRGMEHKLAIHGASLGGELFALEISAEADEDGNFSVDTQGRLDGMLSQGQIRFNTGALEYVGDSIKNLQYTVKATGEVIDVNINFTEQVTQYKATVHGEGFTFSTNGHVYSKMTAMQTKTNGEIWGSYTDGRSRRIGFVPLGTVKNLSDLEESVYGTYKLKVGAGEMKIGDPEQFNAAIICKALESSNIDGIETMSSAKDYEMWLRQLAKAEAIMQRSLTKVMDEI